MALLKAQEEARAAQCVGVLDEDADGNITLEPGARPDTYRLTYIPGTDAGIDAMVRHLAANSGPPATATVYVPGTDANIDAMARHLAANGIRGPFTVIRPEVSSCHRDT